MTAPKETIVIGGGIIGLACAYFLNARGLSVRVIHAAGLHESTSCGNAGGVATAEIIPLSGPATLLSAPKWLFDPLGPLSIRASYLPRLLPWFWRFIRSGTPAKRLYLARAMADLLKTAHADHAGVLKATGLSHLLQKKGTLFVYKSERGLKRDQKAWDIRSSCGIEYETLDRSGILQFEPALGPLATCGHRVEDWAHYRDPAELVTGLAAYLRTQGVAFEQGHVANVNAAPSQKTRVVLADGRSLEAENIVLATGAWSTELAAQLGSKVVLESERGYNTTLPDPGVDIRSFVTFSEDFFVMTPMQMGLRIGGAVEFAGLKAPENFKRSKALVTLAKSYLPNLNTKGGTEWMGHRPSTPDSVPVISASPLHQNVFFAFGHGHLGLTGSMTTGRLISELVAKETPTTDLTPFRIDRF